MSEDTHYQVALTNGQVLTAFAVLLGCLVAVFFAGVWLGRGSVDETPAYAASDRLPEVTDEFAFFSGDDAATESEAAGAPPSEPVAEPERRRRTRQQDRRSKPPAGDPSPPEAMEPKGTHQAAATEEPVPPSPDSAKGIGGFTIQVFASADRAKAESLVERLMDADFRAYVTPSDDPDKEIYRVRVGPLPSRELAETQASELERRWGLESWISASAP